ncbi:MAG: hypothetical protein NTU76_00835 [Candidatus Taylorbacteria bacterium]|nr:hypothetical protein [Candidatus Taylorbacteria bacterium]
MTYKGESRFDLEDLSLNDLEKLRDKYWAEDKTKADTRAAMEAQAAENAGCNLVCRGMKAVGGFLADTIIGFPIRVIFIPVAKILMAIAGKILDFSIHYTIFSGQMQNFDGVVKEIWTIIRDVFNISFIFILLYIAIKEIIGSTSVDTKKMLGSIIISALFINFSFFISRVVIDGGNMVATAFLNRIQGDTTEQAPSIQESVVSFVTKSIAGLDSKEIKLSSVLANNIGIGKIGETLSTIDKSEKTGLVGLIITLILVLIVTYVFFFLAFLIIGRFVMLIFLVAVSPIGFVGGSIPGMKKHADEWRHELINQTILAPVFMFFMLLITKIAAVPAIAEVGASSSATGLQYFKFLLIIFFLFKAVGESKRLSGKIGGLADKAASFATGAALAVATGGTALIARQTIGRGAAALAKGSVGRSLQASAAKGGIVGGLSNLGLKGIKGTANASMDVRNTAVARQSLGFVKSAGGIDLAGDRAKGGGNYGKDKTGFAGWKEKRKDDVARQSQEYDKTAKDYQASLDTKALNRSKKERLVEEEAKKKLEEAENNLATGKITTTDRDAIKTDYETKKKARIDAEKNTSAELTNRAEAGFEAISATDPRKKAYEDAEAEIQNIRTKQNVNATALKGGTQTQDQYDKEEAKLQLELAKVVTEKEKAKVEGIKNQMKIVETEILDKNNPNKKQDASLIKILTTRNKLNEMRQNYADQLRKKILTFSNLSVLTGDGLSEREELATIVESSRGTTREKTETEKTLAELMRQIEALKSK